MKCRLNSLVFVHRHEHVLFHNSKKDKNNNGFIEIDEILQNMVDAAKAQQTRKLAGTKITPEDRQKKIDSVLIRKEGEMKSMVNSVIKYF